MGKGAVTNEPFPGGDRVEVSVLVGIVEKRPLLDLPIPPFTADIVKGCHQAEADQGVLRAVTIRLAFRIQWVRQPLLPIADKLVLVGSLGKGHGGLQPTVIPPLHGIGGGTPVIEAPRDGPHIDGGGELPTEGHPVLVGVVGLGVDFKVFGVGKWNGGWSQMGAGDDEQRLCKTRASEEGFAGEFPWEASPHWP